MKNFLIILRKRDDKMNAIQFKNNLSIKKIESNNKQDWGMIHELEQDPLVYGKTGYLWYLSSTILDSKYHYLERDDIYNAPFAIYHTDFPIGYLQISPIIKSSLHSSVDLSYAILKRERKNGYMKSVLSDISDYILEDGLVNEINLMIHPENTASQLTAIASGFTGILMSDYDGYDDNYWVYRKKRETPKITLP